MCMWMKNAVAVLCRLFVLWTAKQHLWSQSVDVLLSLAASKQGRAAAPAQMDIC